jgi:hypothetical protein
LLVRLQDVYMDASCLTRILRAVTGRSRFYIRPGYGIGIRRP